MRCKPYASYLLLFLRSALQNHEDDEQDDYNHQDHQHERSLIGQSANCPTQQRVQSFLDPSDSRFLSLSLLVQQLAQLHLDDRVVSLGYLLLELFSSACHNNCQS